MGLRGEKKSEWKERLTVSGGGKRSKKSQWHMGDVSAGKTEILFPLPRILKRNPITGGRVKVEEESLSI